MTQLICTRCRRQLASDEDMKWHSKCVRTVEIAGVITEPDGSVDSVIEAPSRKGYRNGDRN